MVYNYQLPGTALMNGNLITQSVRTSAGWPGQLARQSFAQSYTYDPLTRLLSTAETHVGGLTNAEWKQNYLYDGFGNRAVTATGSTIPVTVVYATPTVGDVASLPFDSLSQWNPASGTVTDDTSGKQISMQPNRFHGRSLRSRAEQKTAAM